MFLSPEKTIEAFELTPGMIIADIGSGAGFYTFPIARSVGPKGKVFALDIRQGVLDLMKSRARSSGIRNIEVLWVDLEKPLSTHLPDGILDGVLLANILFQIENRESFAKETARILKPRGSCYVIDWGDDARAMPKETKPAIGPPLQLRFSKNEAQKFFTGHQFIFKKEFSAGEYHYGLMFQKAP